MNAELVKAAWSLAKDCAAIKPGEVVTVVTDLRQETEIGQAIQGAALAAGAEASLVTIESREGNRLSESVLAALKLSDVVIFCAKLPFIRKDVEAVQFSGRPRVLSSFKVNTDMLVRTVPIDYAAMRAKLEELSEAFKKASQLTIIGTGGSRLTASIKNRPVSYVAGCIEKPGDISYIPGGVMAITPLEVSVNGSFVINGSTTVTGRCAPITCTVKDGRVVKIEGGAEARALEEHFRSMDDGAWWVAEIGTGANPKARLNGTSEDERISASIHIGIGHNLHLGGSIESKSHVDVIMVGQTLEIDGKPVIKDGGWA